MTDQKTLKKPYVPKIRNIEDLIGAEYNPRRITGKEMDDLKDSIKRFGITEFPIVNMHPDRENIIISGHQRTSACKELGIEEITCIEVNLSKDLEMELNVRMNKSGGKFDHDILDEFFERDDLIQWGFLEDELPVIEVPEDLDITVENPVYPIVPVLSEKYDYVIIVANNEIDIAYLENYFELEKNESYKNSKVAVGRVVSFDKFKEKVRDERVG
jgi:hypothetical protein